MALKPDISIIMPVCAWPDPLDMNGDPHPNLLDALHSVTQGLAGAPDVRVELLVCVDGWGTKVPALVEQWASSNPSILTRIFRFKKDDDALTWGNRQRNAILDMCAPTGRLIVWQDQDDRFFRGALGKVVDATLQRPGRPFIFRMQVCADRNGSDPFVLWKEKGRVERGHIGGHMLVVPNEPELIGRWLPETSYSADFDFIESTLAKFRAAGREAFWSEEFISTLRPHMMGA